MGGRGLFSGWTTRLWRRKQIAPGVRLNLSKSGPSVSFGGRGGHVTYGPKGTTETIGIPGTGAYLQRRTPKGRRPVDDAAAVAAGLQLERLLEAIQDVIVDELDRTRGASLGLLDEGDLDAAWEVYFAWGRASWGVLQGYRSEAEGLRGWSPVGDSFLQLVDHGLDEFIECASLFGQGDFENGIAQLKRAHEEWRPVTAAMRQTPGQE